MDCQRLPEYLRWFPSANPLMVQFRCVGELPPRYHTGRLIDRRKFQGRFPATSHPSTLPCTLHDVQTITLECGERTVKLTRSTAQHIHWREESTDTLIEIAAVRR
jgi:hypothetical protein